VLLLWGFYLLRLEWRRFAADKAPGPPPTPEEAALERWSAGVVMLVAGLSIVGALVAFWASGQFSSASGMSQQAVQEVTEYQTIKAEQDSYLDFGARLDESFQEGTVAESSLYAAAAAAWVDNQPVVAQGLEARARVAAAGQRALGPGFLCYGPSGFGPGGTVIYNEAALRAFEVLDPCTPPGQDVTALRTLTDAQANTLESSAAGERSTAEKIVLTGALIIVAVFFLTLSYLGRKHRRVGPLGAGVAAVGAALVMAVVAALA
jgi:hypothetical protein